MASLSRQPRPRLVSTCPPLRFIRCWRTFTWRLPLPQGLSYQPLMAVDPLQPVSFPLSPPRRSLLFHSLARRSLSPSTSCTTASSLPLLPLQLAPLSSSTLYQDHSIPQEHLRLVASLLARVTFTLRVSVGWRGVPPPPRPAMRPCWLLPWRSFLFS